MELLAIVHLLWERRFLVGIGVVLAVAVGMLASRVAPAAGPGTGVGAVRMALDTTDSQLVAAAPDGAETLPTRAWLLANTVAADASRRAIARTAGVPEDQLVVISPAEKPVPAITTPLVKQVGAAVAGGDTPFVVELTSPPGTPVITVRAYAAHVPRARRLAGAAAAELRVLAAAQDRSRSRQFVLRTTTPLEAAVLPSSSRRSYLMAAGAGGTFGLWCAALLLTTVVARRLRMPERAPAG